MCKLVSMETGQVQRPGFKQDGTLPSSFSLML